MDPHELEKVKAVVMAAIEPLLHMRISDAHLKFEDSRPLGAGGFGDVKLATLLSPGLFESTHSTRQVAVKEIRPTCQASFMVKRFARELKVWSLLRHRNIIPLIGFDISDDLQRCRLICPWMVRGNIKALIECPETTVECRAELANDVLQGLIYLHNLEVPIVHGDLKAENVLLDGKGRGVVCDFGMATLLQEPSDTPSGLSTGGGYKGSYRWSSPESVDADDLTTSSDIWSWGMLCLEIMSGKIPYYETNSLKKIICNICLGRIPRQEDYGDLPPWRLLEQCWNMDPAARPDAIECSTAFQEIFGLWGSGGGLLLLPETFPEECQRFGCMHVVQSPFDFAAHEALHFRHDQHVCCVCTASFSSAATLRTHLNIQYIGFMVCVCDTHGVGPMDPSRPEGRCQQHQDGYFRCTAPFCSYTNFRKDLVVGHIRQSIIHKELSDSIQSYYVSKIRRTLSPTRLAIPPETTVSEIIGLDAFLQRLGEMELECGRYGLRRLRNVMSHLQDLGYVDLAQQLEAEFQESLQGDAHVEEGSEPPSSLSTVIDPYSPLRSPSLVPNPVSRTTPGVASPYNILVAAPEDSEGLPDSDSSYVSAVWEEWKRLQRTDAAYSVLPRSAPSMSSSDGDSPPSFFDLLPDVSG